MYENLCLNNFIIHTKFDTIGFYTKKITNKYRFLNIRVTLCDLQGYWMIFEVILYFIKDMCRHDVDFLEKLEKITWTLSQKKIILKFSNKS